MNDFKRALLNVAGDMTESENELKNRLLYKQKRKKKVSLTIVPVFIITLVILGFSLWLIPKQSETQLAKNLFENEYLFDYFVARQSVQTFQKQFDDSLKNLAYEDLLNVIGIVELAKEMNITISNEEYQAEKEKSDALLEMEGAIEMQQQLLTRANLSQKEYDQFVRPSLIELQLYKDKLAAIWLNENPNMLEGLTTSYTEQLAEQWMQTHFVKEQQAFINQHQIVPSFSSPLPFTGVVAAVEGKMIYFIQNMTYQELTSLSQEQIFESREEKLATWTMNIENIPLQVGDYVKIRIDSTLTDHAKNITNALNYGIETIMPADALKNLQQVEISSSEMETWNSLLSEVKWQTEGAYNNISTPYAIVHTPEKTYTLFKNNYKNILIVPFGEDKIAKITQGRSEKIEAFLQEIKTK